ncbi:MAG: CpsD/CapB family tyrosine-protein kinase [Acidobacteria bacterium]|nr:CpsD/CapB family tyrosine-protein kinase [Acidobacteriota bacterium]
MSRIDEALAKARVSRPDDMPDAAALAAGLQVEYPVEEPMAVPEADTTGEASLDQYPLEAVEPGESSPAPGQPLDSGERFARIPATEKLVSGLADSATVEQFRRLAGRLHIAQAERGARVVMVTSANVGEGKTLTATNLALTLGESYKKRVLLIDADLRRPWVHELFQVPNVTGLNDGLNASVDRKVPVIRFSEYLSVVTAGRPEADPMGVLTSDRMHRILKDAAEAFDWVIIDTPPVALLTDAHLLASLVDSVLLVVRAGKTQLAGIKKAVEAVGRDKVLGVVLNCAETAAAAGAYQYYAASSNGEMVKSAR